MAYDQPPAEPNPEISAHAEVTLAAASMLLKGFWEAATHLPEPDDFDDRDLAQLWTAILDVHKAGPARADHTHGGAAPAQGNGLGGG